MGRHPRVSFPGAIVHTMARGNARQNIFLFEEGWKFFLDLLEEQRAKTPFRLYAYCLMSNHLHLLMEPVAATISLIMKILLSRYARYFNARLGRTGHVFQDRFRTSLCQRGPYFQELARYIHLNPVRAGMVGDPSAWPYSGHREYLGQGRRALVDQGLLLSMFDDDAAAAREAYERFILEGMQSASGEGISAWRPLAIDIGPARLIPTDEKPEAAPLRRDFDEIVAGVTSSGGISVEVVRGLTRMRSVCRVRREFMWTALRDGHSMTDIADYLRLSVAAVSKALASLRKVES